MLDLHAQTGGEFRVIYNGAYAGATIPWHLHLHITTDPFPVEQLSPDRQLSYPTPLRVFADSETVGSEVADYVTSWDRRNPRHHRVNLLVASPDGRPRVFVFLRDTRVTIAGNKGLMGGWEVAGDFAYSDRREDFETADIETVRASYAEIRPPACR
jgi:hypothetical protein